MLHSDPEVSRLLNLIPASSRIFTKIVDQPNQSKVLTIQFPYAYRKSFLGGRSIAINFRLWQQLPEPQRDLLLLRTVSWVTTVRWFKPDFYQGAVAVGLVGVVGEFFEGDLTGLIVAMGLVGIGLHQVWRVNHSAQRELEVDLLAVRSAGRQGYPESEAARHLLEGIEAVACLEGRISLSFLELLRCQNLRSIAELSAAPVPNRLH
jgi:hypothetical protein